MKLSEVIKYINTALNYPALTYIDIDVFFDMAISELNTTLHTSLPLVKDMIKAFRQNLSTYEANKIILTEDPENTNFIIPTDPENPLENNVECYYSTSTRKFYILNKYAHNYKNHYVKQQYLPDSLQGSHFYEPTDKCHNCFLSHVDTHSFKEFI